jgi:hypothetical protein
VFVAVWSTTRIRAETAAAAAVAVERFDKKEEEYMKIKTRVRGGLVDVPGGGGGGRCG